ncbi:O-antigen ligase family protein [Flexivirga meconopsidis]|uniref:O-antigen ligase family protein n=1 Tax=Flexivirga meconopsidis TaxID=2977121 RepID=UPI002240CB52|nr:O-antigen ligase family protein [Flexivirga meconopsidis]
MAFVSGAATQDSSLFRYSIRFILPMLIAFYLARRLTVSECRAFVTTVLVFTCSQLLIGAMEMGGLRIAPYPSYTRSDVTFGNNITGGDHRAEAFLSHPIPFSMLIVFALFLAWTPFGPKNKVLRLLFSVACLGGLVISGSRTGFVAVASVVLISAIGPRISSRARGAAIAAGVIAVGVLAYSTTVQEYMSEAIAKLGNSGSYTHRSNSISSIPQILDLRSGWDLLFGTGIGSEKRPPYVDILNVARFTSVDNQFTSTLVWGGVVALLALAVAVGVAIIWGSSVGRGILVVLVVYMFSFDLLLWAGESVMLAFGLGLAVNGFLAPGKGGFLAPSKLHLGPQD